MYIYTLFTNFLFPSFGKIFDVSVSNRPSIAITLFLRQISAQLPPLVLTCNLQIVKINHLPSLIHTKEQPKACHCQYAHLKILQTILHLRIDISQSDNKHLPAIYQDILRLYAQYVTVHHNKHLQPRL